MKITDGKKTVEIRIQRWNGSGYDPDWSTDYFDAGTLPYNEDGACCKYDAEAGEFVRDEDMCVFVTEL